MQKSDISLYFFDMKSCMVLLHTYFEGSVSQICCLGPSFYFMLFRK